MAASANKCFFGKILQRIFTCFLLETIPKRGLARLPVWNGLLFPRASLPFLSAPPAIRATRFPKLVVTWSEHRYHLDRDEYESTLPLLRPAVLGPQNRGLPTSPASHCADRSPTGFVPARCRSGTRDSSGHGRGRHRRWA